MVQIFRHAILRLKLLQENINGFLLELKNGSAGYLEFHPR
jgi:hypothetical protein